MAQTNYPFMRNGYMYSKGTKAGFLRMQRQGIPRPLFRIEDQLAKLLRTKYRALTRQLLKDIKAQCAQSNIVLDAAPDDDDVEALLKFFNMMEKELREENERVIARINLNTVANTLEHEWFEEKEEEEPEYFVRKIDETFKKEQADYLKRLFMDADGKTATLLRTFSIDKQKFFNDNMDAVRKLYLDNSIERIRGEESLLKRRILKKIIDYADGTTDKLELSDLVREGYEGSDKLARLFARDQMQRFNKACTLSTFRSAGVTKVKWVTCGDVRVRKSHKELNGKIFDVNNLPAEVDDYNCRCGLVPVAWEDD
ncbi:MAG: minor capsid protein [Methanocorpusculum sp.]|nr:minor capsid protein [Methanocorpusculum sp.]